MLSDIKMIEQTTHVRLLGFIYIDDATNLREVLNNHINDGKRKFVIDLGEVSYIDSSGLGVLIEIQKKLTEKNGDMIIKNLNGNVKELFELTRLTKFFTIEY